MRASHKHTLVLLWGRWGPYHHARYRALRQAAEAQGSRVIGIEYSPASRDYGWMQEVRDPDIFSLKCTACETQFSVRALLLEMLPLLERERPAVIFVPGYWHWSLFTAILGRLLGARIVMMNESHAATVKPGRIREFVRRVAVRLFDAAFVGGQPQRNYFAHLGIPTHRITTGYDAVDNAFFAQNAAAARDDVTPPRYFLWAGRMEPKKDIPTLVRGWELLFKRLGSATPDLHLVGDGTCKGEILVLCHELGLPVDATGSPSVHFAPFAPPAQLARMYGQCLAFILSSSLEEWGLVVNEALAAGAPVVVSSAAGCAEALLLRTRYEDISGAGVLCRGGLVFPSGDAEALSRCLELLSTQANLREQLAAEACAAVKPFSLEAFAHSALRAAAIAQSP